MKGLIHCQDLFHRLEPLSQHVPLYLLPICNKPLIEYQLEAMYALGVREVRLVVYEQGHELEKYLGSGQKMGLEISYIPGHALDDLPTLLNKNKGFIQDAEGLVVMDGLVLPMVTQNDPILPEAELLALGLSERFDQTCFYLSAQALSRLRGDETNCWDLHWQVPSDSVMQLWCIESLQEYFQLNHTLFKIGQGRISFPTYHENSELGLGQQVRLADSVRLGSRVILGDRVFVDEEVILDQAILGSDVVVGARTRISNTVILGQTQIGSDLDIQGKIVVGETLIDPYRQMALTGDAQLCSPVKAPQASRWGQSLLALGMMAIQAPFYWLLKPTDAQQYITLLPQDSEPLSYPEFRTLPSNTRAERLFFKLSLHKFPLWKEVLKGRLDCVGNTLLPESDTCGLLPSEIPNYRPGVFSYPEYLRSSAQQQPLDELYYSAMRTSQMDREVFWGALKQNWRQRILSEKDAGLSRLSLK